MGFQFRSLPEKEIEDIDALVLDLIGQVYIRCVKFIVGWKSKAARCADPRAPAGAWQASCGRMFGNNRHKVSTLHPTDLIFNPVVTLPQCTHVFVFSARQIPTGLQEQLWGQALQAFKTCAACIGSPHFLEPLLKFYNTPGSVMRADCQQLMQDWVQQTYRL